MPIYRLPVATSSLPLRKYSSGSSSSSGSSNKDGGRQHQHPQQHYNNQHPSQPKHHIQQQQQQYLDPNENIVKRSHSIPTQMTAINHFTSASERAGIHPSNESIIEREIRLQLEREAEIAQLHGREVSQGGASNHSHGDFAAAEVTTHHSLEMHGEPRGIVRSSAVDFEDGRKAIRQYSRVGESLIVKEMLEQRRREEELRNHWRKLEALKTEEMAADRKSSSFVGNRPARPGSGENVSSPAPPSANIRTVLRVQPFEDPDDDSKQTFISPRMETVMEREIRLQRQREGSFRRARGYPLQSKDDRLEEVEIYPPPAMRLGKPGDQRGLQQPGLDRRASDWDTSDEMSVQRFATNRLKQEMFKERQRELDLRKQGKIYTISEERVGLDPEPFSSNQSLFDEESMIAGASASQSDSLATLKEQQYLQQHQSSDRYVSDNGRTTSHPVVVDEQRSDRISPWRTASELRIEDEVREARRREKELREQRRLANDALIHQLEQHQQMQRQQDLSSQLQSRKFYRRT